MDLGVSNPHILWKPLANLTRLMFTTVELLPFGLDWTRVAEIRFSENKDLPDDNDLPKRQKVRNSTVEVTPCLDLVHSVSDLGASLKLDFHRGIERDSASPSAANMVIPFMLTRVPAGVR